MKNKPIWWLVNILIVLFLSLFAWVFYDLPSFENLNTYKPVPSIQIVDRNEETIYDILPPTTGRNRPLEISEIPPAIIHATIATEDQRFYQNEGFDLPGMLRSLLANVQSGQIVGGGSTITQQVVRNLVMTPDERQQISIRRKLREVYLAWRLTKEFSKEKILELYLNNMYYGNMAYGIEAAAQTYFNKSASDLDLAESALLVGLTQAPEYYNPFGNLELALQRQQSVLALMEKNGYIRASDRELAAQENLQFSGVSYPTQAIHFSLWIRSQLDSLLTPEELARPYGLTVHTTIDMDWQRRAETIIDAQLNALRQEIGGANHNVNSMSLVAINTETGEVLSMVGSPDFFNQDQAGAINMTLVPRQPGSALKPIVYAVALDPKQSDPWTAATMLLDVKTHFVTRGGEAYTPTNYDNREHGPVLVRQALGSSLNIPAILTLQYIGIDRLLETAHRMGISTLISSDQYDLSLALGGGEVSLLELTSAYAVFANGGYYVTAYAVESIVDGQGNVLYSHSTSSPRRVIDERVAWLISDILSDDQARTLGFGSNSMLNIGRPAAVKTGTTSNFHDNWTVGYVPGLVVGVWAGNTDQSPMYDVTGMTGAGPVWHNFIRAVLQEQEIQYFTQPPGMTEVEVCALSGMLPSEACPFRRREWFIQGTEPNQLDTMVQKIDLDVTTGFLANEYTPTGNRVSRWILDLPPQAQEWAHSHGYYLINELNDSQENPMEETRSSDTTIFFSSPIPNAVYIISPKYPRDIQLLGINVLSSMNLSKLEIYIDHSLYETVTSVPFDTHWSPVLGMHSIWAIGYTPDGKAVKSNVIQFEIRMDEN